MQSPIADDFGDMVGHMVNHAATSTVRRVEPPTVEPPTVDIQAFFDAERIWSEATFGPRSDRGATGPLKHLQLEAVEAIHETDHHLRTVEMADCLLLLMDACWRHGLTWNELMLAAVAKQQINIGRKWAKKTADGPTFHVEESHATS